LPPATPATCHVTFVFALPKIFAVNICVWLTASVTAFGDTEMLASLVSVTVAVLETFVFAWLVARTVTVTGEGSETGAVYVVVSAPELFVTDPKVEFPPMTPFTSQVTLVFGDPVT
jgi:hypothetical protein